MSQIETQLVITLQQVARAIAAVGQSAQRSPLEVWGPPIAAALISMGIAAAGWLAIDRSNQKNNRDLVELQTRELARNGILDALDDYRDYLADVRWPRAAILRNITATNTEAGSGNGRGATLDPVLISSSITALMMYDPRETHWRKQLDRNSWVYAGDPALSNGVRRLELDNEQINMDLFAYRDELLTRLKEGSAATFLQEERKAESIVTIDGQLDLVSKVHARLNTPEFLHTPVAKKKWAPLQ
jgi:hypothetical protein